MDTKFVLRLHCRQKPVVFTVNSQESLFQKYLFLGFVLFKNVDVNPTEDILNDIFELYLLFDWQD